VDLIAVGQTSSNCSSDDNFTNTRRKQNLIKNNRLMERRGLVGIPLRHESPGIMEMDETGNTKIRIVLNLRIHAHCEYIEIFFQTLSYYYHCHRYTIFNY
ncbi:hypothetical protein L9F63_015003, partial [Diploptera punctata]